MYSGNRSGGRSRIPNYGTNRHRSSSVSMYSRDSYGSIARRASSEERKSGNSAIRRYSSAVRNSLSNEKGSKDVRPLTDKSYQKKKTAELYEFLLEHDFKGPLAHTKLMQPSKKEYEMIFQFLVRFFEPTFEVRNLEDDALRILKSLDYPFTPNKSVFTYVARTSFSPLLGVLVFLMDNAKFSLNIDLSKLLLTGDTDRPEEHSELMNYIFDSYSRPGTDTEMATDFEKLIRNRGGHNLSELEQRRDLKYEKLMAVKKDLENINTLHTTIEDFNNRIKRYEDYFCEMKKCKEKKEAAILKLNEEVEEKRSIIHNLKETLSKKQALYDAQGFDGRKHLNHFEDLKKELNETLQQKKAYVRTIQDECWSLDMEYTKILDKGDKLCKDLVHKFSQVTEAVEANFHNLRNIRDPEVQNVCNGFRIEIPECPADTSQRAFMAWIDEHKESLEEFQKKIQTTVLILRTINSEKSEELTMVEMKKLNFSTKLKCSSSVEVQKEHDLTNLEKKAVEEVRILKDEYDRHLTKLEELQNDERDKMDKLSKLESNLHEIEKIKKRKSEMFEKYKEEQKKYLMSLESTLKAESKKCEDYGLEILKEFQEFLKKHKKETQ